MYFYNYQVLTQEVPGEISLCFNITGCPHRCLGCHSPFLWKKNNGSLLTKAIYKELLDRYFGLVSCILFMGGEWEPKTLYEKLNYAQVQGYKTCLYTGAKDLDPLLKMKLTWLKTGSWDPDKGGLDNTHTNQQFIEVSTNKNLNHLFQKS